MEMHMNGYITASLTVIIVILLLITMTFAASDTATTTASVNVNEFLSVTLSNAPVSFPNMDPGTTENATVGNGFPLTVTIGAESNVNANITTEANSANFAGPGTLAVSNMKWSDSETGLFTEYTTTNATVCSGVSPGSNCDIYHKLSVPGGTTAGTYTVDITVTAISV